MVERMNINLSGTTFADETHTDCGAAAFELDHDWFTEEDLVIRTAAAGGGTLLVLDTDYQLVGESVDDATKGVTGLSTRTAKTVYHQVQILNASYQTGTLYFSGKYIGDSIDADDYNYLLSRLRPKGHLHGLTLSNGTDATNDIDIAAGEAVDNSDGSLMVRAAVLTKQLDAAWAVGTNAGGRDTGSIADGWWAVWLIKRPDTGVVDALFSLSSTSPTMPTNYTLKRRIGWINRASSAIRAFVQVNDRFRWPAEVVDRSYAAISADTRTLQTVTAPVNMPAILNLVASTSGSDSYSWVRETSASDAAATTSNHNLFCSSGASTHDAVVVTDSSSQVAHRSNSGTVGVSMRIATKGWIDDRGRSA